MLARNAGPSQSSQYTGTDHKDRSSRPRFVELTNRFHVAVRLFSNRSQMTSKCGENEEMAHEPQASASLQMFLPHFDIFCDLLLNYMESICFFSLYLTYIQFLRRVFLSLLRKHFAKQRVSCSDDTR